MRTNDLFREVLDGRIPLPRRRIRPGFYYLPNLTDPTAPTVAELNAGVDLSGYITTDGLQMQSTDQPKTMTESLQQMAAATGMSAEEIMDLLAKAGAGPKKARIPKYVMPAPPYPVGNIATQKRRRKL